MAANNLYVPVSPNFPDIDSFVPGQAAFQVTVSSTHPFQKTRLDALMKKLSIENLIYVIPKSKADEFKYQIPKTKKGANWKKPCKIPQYSLFVDVEEL